MQTAVLAGNKEWFTDSLPLCADDKKVIKRLKGRWIVEAAETQGLRKGDLEHFRLHGPIGIMTIT